MRHLAIVPTLETLKVCLTRAVEVTSFLLGLEHTFDTVLDFVDGVVDDGVEPDFDTLLLGEVPRISGRPDLEADDDGVRSCSQHDIGFGNRTDRLVDDVDVDLLGGELDE